MCRKRPEKSDLTYYGFFHADGLAEGFHGLSVCHSLRVQDFHIRFRRNGS